MTSGQTGHRRPAQHAARGHVDRVPGPEGRARPTATRPSRSSTTPASMTSMVQPAAAVRTGSVTYSSPPGQPGHLPLRVAAPTSTSRCRWACTAPSSCAPRGHPDQVNDRADSAFNPDHEYVFLLSEVDPDLHLAVERGEPFDWNGVQRPLLHDQRPQHAGHPGAEQRLLAARPSRTAPWCTSSRTTRPPTRCPAVIRYLNAGTVNYPFHPHGSDERVVNKDGQALAGADGAGPVVPEVRHRRPARADASTR